jgi:hypothetical protein
VFPVLASFYAQWRARNGVIPVLHEEGNSPPERLLQAVWQHQRLLRDRIRTLDGQTVRVLHPGFPSVEGGPDFRGASVQFGDLPPQSGDVLEAGQKVELLGQAAHVRLQSKAAQFQARARQAGWEQSLWEGLFRALGYKHNAPILQNSPPLAPDPPCRRLRANKGPFLGWSGSAVGNTPTPSETFSRSSDSG